MEHEMNQHEDDQLDVSQETLAQIGGGEIAYVRPIMSDVVKEVFPEAPDMAPGIRLFLLNAADGTPILLTDSEDSARAGAMEHELRTVSVH